MINKDPSTFEDKCTKKAASKLYINPNMNQFQKTSTNINILEIINIQKA